MVDRIINQMIITIEKVKFHCDVIFGITIIICPFIKSKKKKKLFSVYRIEEKASNKINITQYLIVHSSRA